MLVEFPLEGGGTVFVDVAEAARPAGAVTRGLEPREVATRATETFEAAFGRVQPAAAAMVGKLRSLAEPPDEIEVEFGLQLSGEVGAIVARTAGEAHFKITLRWKRGS